MPGTGKKPGPPAKAEVDGKVFGTGTLVVDEWAVTLLVDPATVAMSNTAEKLRVTSGKGTPDPIHGGFELVMWRKQPGQTPQSVLVDELKKLNVGRESGNHKALFASFDVPAIEDQVGQGPFGVFKVAQQGNCIFELILFAPDIEQLVRLELATRAGILAKVGKTPMPPACQ